MRLSPPDSLTASHRLDAFDSSEPALDEWLKRRAWANHDSGASRTFVVVDDDGCVRGYYALAAGVVSHELAVSKVRRTMPDPVPVLVLGRLTVDRGAQGLRLGSSLLQDAVQRAAAVSSSAGVRALLVHALHERAKAFYERFGFQPSLTHPMTLMLCLPPGG